MKKNKRTYKKSIKDVGASLCENFMIGYYNIDGVDKDKVENAIAMVLGGLTTACDRSNNFFGKGEKEFADKPAYLKARTAFFKDLFNKINSDFSETINSALKLFNEAVPEEVKKANKEALA